MRSKHDSGVTMAIAPTSRGFGYIVFENADLPMDWGVKEVRKHKTRDCLLKAGELIQMLEPSVLVVEDARHANSRRSKRVRELVDKITDIAKERRITVVRCSRDEVLNVFGRMGANSKDDIAAVVGGIVPELAP